MNVSKCPANHVPPLDSDGSDQCVTTGALDDDAEVSRRAQGRDLSAGETGGDPPVMVATPSRPVR